MKDIDKMYILVGILFVIGIILNPMSFVFFIKDISIVLLVFGIVFVPCLVYGRIKNK